MPDREDFERMFHPKAVAVVGAPRTRPAAWPGIFGCIREFGFPGRLYPVNPGVDAVEGIKAWPDLVSLPEPVDLVVVTVPAPAVPEALRDCVASGNRNVHIFTAGFAETGEEEGMRLQREIEDIARRGELNVIGPNCMGVHNPRERFATWVRPSAQSGSLAFVSQSGGHAQEFTSIANRLGLYFSKVISYGNALTLDSTDFLDYLAGDDETDIITMYLEGVRDGRRLLSLVSDATRRKPVIILKGGLTEAGTRAAASHTGALSGGEKLWRGFFSASGAVPAENLQDMAALVLAFRHLRGPAGPRVAVIGHGGGFVVSAADACDRAGLVMPPLENETIGRLRSWIPPGGNMIRNPIDAMPLFSDAELLRKALDTVSRDPGIDMLILSITLEWLYDVDEGRQVTRLAEWLAESSGDSLHGKPFAVTLRTWRNDSRTEALAHRVQAMLHDAAVPAYRNLDQAAGVLARWVRHRQFQSRREGRESRKSPPRHSLVSPSGALR